MKPRSILQHTRAVTAASLLAIAASSMPAHAVVIFTGDVGGGGGGGGGTPTPSPTPTPTPPPPPSTTDLGVATLDLLLNFVPSYTVTFEQTFDFSGDFSKNFIVNVPVSGLLFGQIDIFSANDRFDPLRSEDFENLEVSAGQTNFAYSETATSGGFFRVILRLDPDQVTTPAVPEPATWAMFLLGFGAVGYSMRRRKGTAAPVSFA